MRRSAFFTPGTVRVEFDISSAGWFTDFITELREKLANHSTKNHVHNENHPVLAEQSAMHPERWFFIRLQVKDDSDRYETTLAVRDDNLYVSAFMNKDKKWFVLPENSTFPPSRSSSASEEYPKKEDCVFLEWGVEYNQIMGKNTRVYDTLKNSENLGDMFAKTTVCTLSNYCHVKNSETERQTRKKLACLIAMVCESARMNLLHNIVYGGRWSEEFIWRHMHCIWSWGNISYALLYWKVVKRYGVWPSNKELWESLLSSNKTRCQSLTQVELAGKMARCEISNENDALEVIHLVLNQWIKRPKKTANVQGDNRDGKCVQTPSDGTNMPVVNNSVGAQSNRQVNGSDNSEASSSSQGHGSTGAGRQRSADGQQQEDEEDDDDDDVLGLSPAAGNTSRRGLARVEILAVHVIKRCPIAGMTITVFDGTKGHIIYNRQEEGDEMDPHEEERMVKLLLTGPNSGISGYGNFAIEVDFPTSTGGQMASSSSVDAPVDTITWEWDSYSDKDADQVDVLIEHHTINQNPKVNVSYWVMSNALEATVQVKLRLPEKDEDLPNEEEDDGDHLPPPGKKDGYSKYAAHGKITANIDDRHLIELFRCTPNKKVPIPHSSILPLARSLVMVPCGMPLHVVAQDVKIVDTSTGEVVKQLADFNLKFNCGWLIPTEPINDDEVEVSVTWYPKLEQEKIIMKNEVCVIGDKKEDFATFIDQLRRRLADKENSEGTSSLNGVLAKPRSFKQEERWIHIELQVAGEENSPTTLAVQRDNLYVMGFMNRDRVWYDLGDQHGAKMLPPQYDSTVLGWGSSYTSVLKARSQQEVVNILNSARLGKHFARAAVRKLSRYDPDVKDGWIDPRLALAGLMVMVCESARMNPLRDAVLDAWDKGLEFIQQRMDYIMNWGLISRALMEWKENGYFRGYKNSRLRSIGIKGVDDALKVVQLVLNSLPNQAIITYTIGDKKGYRKFIEDLRKELANRKNGPTEHILVTNGTPTNPVLSEQQLGEHPERWVHIKLLSSKGNETSTAILMLVIRDDNLRVKGFKNQAGTWFELCWPNEKPGEMLPKKYNAKKLDSWGVITTKLIIDMQQLKKALESMRLGRAFLERAVGRLSSYHPADDVENNDEIPVWWLELEGLIVMICESAKMDPFPNYFAGDDWDWNHGKGLTPQLQGYIWNWSNMSAALVKWRDSRYSNWDSRCGVDSAKDALDIVYLVLNTKDDVRGPAGAQVQILAVSANFSILNIKVTDEGQRQHKIYTQKSEDSKYREDNKEKEMQRLELAGQGIYISGYQWFGMEVEFTGAGDDVITKKYKWDCRIKADGEVTEILTRSITLGLGRKIDVSYLVMSNAVDAKVEIKLRLKAGDLEDLPNEENRGSKYMAHGIITACIGGFEQHPIVLFRSEEPIPIESLIFPLARSTVQVPEDAQLQIDMDNLHVTESSSFSTRDLTKPDSSRLSFGSGLTPEVSNDSSEVEVNVSWETEPKKAIQMEPHQKACINVGNDEFTETIQNLRQVFAEHPDTKYVLQNYTGTALPYSENSNPVLASSSAKQPPRWIHIQLQVVDGEEISSTTLAVRADNCYGVGFLSQAGVWYDLGNRRGDKALPAHYNNSVLLNWGVAYKDVLDVQDWDEAQSKLNSARLGKEFAEKAVRTLSRYPDVEDEENPRLALAGLMFIFCESAKFNSIHQHFEQGWDTGTELSHELMKNIRSWGLISRALLQWKDNRFPDEWPQNSRLEEMGIKGPKDALHCLHLVFSSTEPLRNQEEEITVDSYETPPPAINADDLLPYTIGDDKEEYKTFIERLRQTAAKRKDGSPEYIAKGKCRVLAKFQGGKQPERWIHVKLVAKNGHEASSNSTTTLVIRDDNFCVKGFRNEEGKWFEFWEPTDREEEMLPEEYEAEKLKDWGVSYRSMMMLNDKEQVEKTLMSTRLGKAFAERAVRMLARYHPSVEHKDDIPVRLGLAGLTVMICESAKMDPFLDYFAGDVWNRGKGLTKQLANYMWNWKDMSAALLTWGVASREAALDSVRLVLNSNQQVQILGPVGSQFEILAVSANYPVHSIIIIDQEEQKHEIYHGKQKYDRPKSYRGKKAFTMQQQKRKKGGYQKYKPKELELSVRKKVISWHEWFDIEVKLPHPERSDEDIAIKRRLHCHKVQDGEAAELVTRTISLDDPSCKIDLTYLVMSKAVEATVEVRLPGKPGNYLPHEEVVEKGKDGGSKYTAYGKITAHISGFQHPIVLFRRAREDALTFESSTFPLDRSKVQVPRDKKLHIHMKKLHVVISQSSGNKKYRIAKFSKANSPISVRYSSPIIIPVDDGSEVDHDGNEIEVNISGEIKSNKVESEHAGKLVMLELADFNGSIKKLRDEIAKANKANGVIVDEHDCEHPLLKPSDIQEWIHIQLQAVDGEETSWTTLAITADKCYGVGFLNQAGVWYDLGNRRGDKALPAQYNSVLLDWGVSYKDVLDVQDWDEAQSKLNSARLGKEFAEKAVRTLSRYPDVEDEENPRLALAGLMFIFCESAKFNTIQQHFEEGWDAGTELSHQLMKYTRSWGLISRALLQWKDNRIPHEWSSLGRILHSLLQWKGNHFPDEWPQNSRPEEMGIEGLEDALHCLHLVLSSRTLTSSPPGRQIPNFRKCNPINCLSQKNLQSVEA